MGDLILLCSKLDVSEMMPSFCFYYKELVYCHNNQLRIEANKGINYFDEWSLALKNVGKVLGKDVGKFVKHFIVPLQIYMCDTVISVNQTATEVFNV